MDRDLYDRLNLHIARQMDESDKPKRLTAELTVADIAEQIARLLYRADAIKLQRHGFPEKHWNQLSSLEQTRYRSLAQQVVMSLDPMTVSRAESRTIEWVMNQMRHSYRDDFPIFPDDMLRDAMTSAMTEFNGYLEKAWRERVRS